MLVRLIPLLLVLLLVVAVYLVLRQGRAGGPDRAGADALPSPPGDPRLSARPVQGSGGTGESVPADPTTRHAEAVEAARELVQQAEAAHSRAVGRAQERLTEAGLDDQVMRLDGLWLGRLSLVAEGRERRLSADTRFAVDVEGQVRWEPVEDDDGRLRVEADDRREVRLRIDDPGWQERLSLSGDQADEAARMVAAGTAAVRTLDEARSARERRIAVAREELESVQADTEELDRARMTLEDLEGAGPLRGDLPSVPPDGGDGRTDGSEDHPHGPDGSPRPDGSPGPDAPPRPDAPDGPDGHDDGRPGGAR